MKPRSVAVTAVATRVADEMGCKVGEGAGYSIRFDDTTSAVTRIKFLTDALLLREALVDPLLSRYSVVIVDEAHERSISTDLLLGILKKIQKQRPDLRIVVSSATIQAEAFLRFFAEGQSGNNTTDAVSDAIGKVITVGGRLYPVDCLYLEAPADDYVDRAIKTVFDIHSTEMEGDILLYLTGQEEIDTAIEKISQEAALFRPGTTSLIPLPLYAGLTTEEQLLVFEPSSENTRKVIVSTNIAETSVTIDGIVYVVDCGYAKHRVYNPTTGIDSLTVIPISKASAKQRAGRAGRTKPGKCFRLYTESFYEALPEVTIPEIQRSNLVSIIPLLKALGIDNIVRFDFLTPPPPELVVRALELLYSLGAVDDYARLSKPLGIQMAELAVEPMMAKTLLASPSFGCVSEILSIAAMTSLRGSIWFAQAHDKKTTESFKRKFAVEEGDHLTYLNIYQAFTSGGNKSPQWCRDRLLNYKTMTKAVSVRMQLKRFLERFGITMADHHSKGPIAAESIQRCLTTGYFAHCAKMQPDGSFKTINGRVILHAHPSSLMFVSASNISCQ